MEGERSPSFFFYKMKKPGIKVKGEFNSIMNNSSTIVFIPDTKRRVKIKWVGPYLLERLTGLWCERDLTRPQNSGETLKSLCKDSYFNHKQAALFVLNSFFRIKLFYPILWRWYAYIRNYKEHQLTPIIETGKKKIPLLPYWTNIVLTMDMRVDWMTMTQKEAEQYQAELISGNAPISAKNSPNTPPL